ncbi:MAG TPA: hypothetical protein VL551_10370 [Actinospica sp.]|jgi:hypothetical protein|nr:hypothetical protein [Actinospica sp.]
MKPKILRGRPATEPARPVELLRPAIGPDTLILTDREMSRLHGSGEATFFSEAFEDIARLADFWWQYHHDSRRWARVTDMRLAVYLDQRRPDFVESDQNHARKRELRRAARANPATGERDES